MENRVFDEEKTINKLWDEDTWEYMIQVKLVVFCLISDIIELAQTANFLTTDSFSISNMQKAWDTVWKVASKLEFNPQYVSLDVG